MLFIWVLNSKNHCSSIDILVLQVPSLRPMHLSPSPHPHPSGNIGYWPRTVAMFIGNCSQPLPIFWPSKNLACSSLAWSKLLAEGGKQRLSQLASIWDHLKCHPSYRTHHRLSWSRSFNCTVGQFFPCLFPHYSLPYSYVSPDHCLISFFPISESVSVSSIIRKHQIILCTKIIWIVALNLVQVPQ